MAREMKLLPNESFTNQRALDGYVVRAYGEGAFSKWLEAEEREVWGDERFVFPRGVEFSAIRPLDEAERLGENIVAAFLQTPASEDGAVAFSKKYGPLTVRWRPTLDFEKEAEDEQSPEGFRKDKALAGETLGLWMACRELVGTLAKYASEGFTDAAMDHVGNSLSSANYRMDFVRDADTGKLHIALTPDNLFGLILFEMLRLLAAGTVFRRCSNPNCNNVMVLGGGRGKTGYSNKHVCSARCRMQMKRAGEKATAKVAPAAKDKVVKKDRKRT